MKKIFFQILLLSFIVISTILISCNKEEPKSENRRFHYDGDGILVLNSKRTFIIGSYYLPNDENPFAELKKNGFNYIRAKAEKEQLDAANKNSLMTWIHVGSIKKDSEEKDKQHISEIIEQYKTHPSVLCWEMEDEPAYTWNSAEARIEPEPLFKTSNFIRQLDKEHLIFTNHAPVNLISTMQKYNNTTDVVAVDVYPIVPHGITPSYALLPDGMQGDLLNTYPSQVGEYVEKMKKVVNNAKPIFAVLQGFAWELLKPEKERTMDMVKFPTYLENRFMAYNAIVHGANGIVYWGWKYTPQPSEFMKNLYKVTTELAEMQDVLAAHTINLGITKQYHELGFSVDTGVEILAKKVNDKIYLLTVNSDKNPVKISLNGLSNYAKAKVLQENRTVDIHNGILTDTYKPFDVHIYYISN